LLEYILFLTRKIGVLIIHGMGRQPDEFSTGLRDELQDRLGRIESRFKWVDIYWAERIGIFNGIFRQSEKYRSDSGMSITPVSSLNMSGGQA